jgi:3'(2'), 5'-bisphosphate nucleotidase
MLETNHPEIKFAIDAVRAASLLVQTIQTELVPLALTKEDRSPVTVADFAAQALVGFLLSAAFPRDALIGEEDSSSLLKPEAGDTLERITGFVRRSVPKASPELVCSWIDLGSAVSADRYWTLDPIDGTKGFLRGDQYAVALALVYDGDVQVGLMGCPNLEIGDQKGVLFMAIRGGGAWVSPLKGEPCFKQVHVSQCTDASRARMLRSFESAHTNVNQIDVLAQELGIEADPVRMDSQAKYGVLASGMGEIYIRLLSPNRPDYREKIWDQAAGSIIIEEAGGRVSDLDGLPLDFTKGRTLADNRGICATNGNLHEKTLAAIKSIGA